MFRDYFDGKRSLNHSVLRGSEELLCSISTISDFSRDSLKTRIAHYILTDPRNPQTFSMLFYVDLTKDLQCSSSIISMLRGFLNIFFWFQIGLDSLETFFFFFMEILPFNYRWNDVFVFFSVGHSFSF